MLIRSCRPSPPTCGSRSGGSSIGAVAVKNAVHALHGRAQEDFEWLLREIARGGEAIVCEARLVEGLTDQEVRTCSTERGTKITRSSPRSSALAAALADDPPPERRAEAKAQLARLKARLAQIAAIDFFGADGRRWLRAPPRARGRLREKEPPAAGGRAAGLGELKAGPG